ncbi:MAG: ATP-binding protein [Microcoleus sp.]
MKNKIDEIPSGGIGLKLIGKIADELNYTPTSDSRNCLLIVKYYQPSPRSSQAGYFKRARDFLKSFYWLKKQRTPQSKPSFNQPMHKISLKLNSDIKGVTQVLGWFESCFLEYLPIPKAVLYQFKLATVEGFTNAVRHAHKNLPPETPIELEITVFNSRLELKIWDWGKPFDLTAKLKEELPETSLFSRKELGFTLD